MKPAVALVFATLALLVCGCSGSPSSVPSPASASPTTSPTVRAADQRPTLPEIVADPKATLSIVSVRPGPDGLTVRAWWLLPWTHDRTLGAIVTSDDRMRSASYAAGTYRQWAAHEPPLTRPSPAPGMGDLMASDVFSLQDGTRAQQGGSDGATLDPFQRLLRSVDGGPWERFDVPQTRGQQAYTSGQVVLPDGRLLVLLDAWSSDHRGRPNPVWHGLWVSDGDDWSSYRPWRPTFTPKLPRGVRPWPSGLEALQATDDPRTGGGIIWVTTLDRVYVSTDAARTFREVAARPS